MDLSKEQLLQIDNYIFVCGIQFYDVRTEVVDHFANILEQKLEENPALNFKHEIINIHKNFSDNGFKKLLEEKTKWVTKKFYKQSFKHFITFFKLPKIILSAATFYGLFLIMNEFGNKENFFNILQGVALLLSFRLLFNVNMRNTKKEQFLSINMTHSFFNVFYLLVMLFRFHDSQILLNLLGEFYQIFYIGAYVLLFLFYWSGEYVYRQNKIEVQRQYPNILV
tara:strand:+ start:857 stop:1528 length:672 start_codon:yes stop_codon:yes gene_type:complete